MAANDNLRVVFVVPVLGLLAAAPQREARNSGEHDEVFSQLPVSDYDQPDAWMRCDGFGELRLRLLDERMAPLNARGVRVGVQQVLVGCLNVFFSCPAKRVFELHVSRPKAVVVKCEDGCNQTWPALTFPQRKVVLRSEHTESARHLYTLHVLGLASCPVFFLGRQRVQLMVAGHPEDAPEALGRLCERDATMLDALTHVPAQYEVVIRMWQELIESFAIGLEGEVNVANGPKASGLDR